MRLVPILAALSSSIALTVATQPSKLNITKAVFAHYMVGTVTYEHIVKDVDDAVGMGLDGFALNVGDPTQPFVADLFNGMFGYVLSNYPNFKLFLSMDLWALGNAFNDKPDITKYSDLMNWKGHDAWYHGPNGSPFISSFSSGGMTNDSWLAWKTSYANDMYLVPDIDDTAGYNTSDPGWWAYWGPIVDGTFFWESAWPKVGDTNDGDVTLDNVVAAGSAKHNASYMAPLSALQYKNSYGTNYYRHGELNLVKRMENILSMPVKPDFVEVMTWVRAVPNDGPESHYIGNLWLEQNNDTDPLRYSNQQQWSHDGWRPLISSFITAFKYGQVASEMAPPSGVAAVGSLWYKTMLKDSVCPSDHNNTRAAKPDGWEAGNDNLNWAIVVPSGQSFSVRLLSNGTVLATIALTAGLNYGAQAGIVAGPQRMELINSAGAVMLAATGGRCVSSGCPDCIYNMNYQVVELTTDTGDEGICPYRACSKQVFAHYMVGTVSTLHAQQDIADAAAIGFDGFALNIGDPRQSFVRDAFNSMFDYARDNYPDFKLFFSLDLWAEGNALKGPSDPTLYHDLLQDFKGHDAYLQGPNGQSFISTYSSGGGHNTTWIDFRAAWGQALYLVPEFGDTAGWNTSDPGWWDYWGDIIDGGFSWETTWPHPGETTTGTVAIDQVVAAGMDMHLKSYMMPLSPLQYKDAYDTNYYRQGELNLPMRMKNLLSMESLPDFVEYLTWNDGPESHYIGNLWPEQNSDEDPGRYANSQFDHKGWQPLLTSFITAFKSKESASGMRPPSGQDAIGAMWYKTVLQDTICPYPDATQYTSKPNGFSAPDQMVWAVVVSDAAAGTTIVASVDGAQVGSQTAVAGLNYGSAPISAGFPKLVFGSLAAGGGRCVSSECPDCIFNMNPQVLGLTAGAKADGLCPPTLCAPAGGFTQTTDGTCGAQNVGTYCGSWSGGACCNANGACDWNGCGDGCQSGPCINPSGYTPSGPVFFDRSIWGQGGADTKRDINPLNMGQMAKRAVDGVDLKCIPPCTLVVPPYSLATATTVSFPALTTEMIQEYYTSSLVSRGADYTVTEWDIVTVTVTITVDLPAITTTNVPFWNIPISSGTANSSLTFVPSFQPSPVTVTDNTSPASGVTVSGETRTITPLPYPQTGSPGITSGPDSIPETGTFQSAQPTSICTVSADQGGCGELCDPQKDPTLCIAAAVIIAGGAGAGAAALLLDPVPVPGEPVRPGDDETCEVLTAYIYTKIISSYVPASVTTYSTVTNFQSEITMGCDATDSTTTTTEETSSTSTAILVEYTPEVYLDLDDDDSQDDADASSIAAELSSWAPTYGSMTAPTAVQTTVEPRPTVTKSYPITSVSCGSSSSWLTVAQMTSAYGEFCAKIGGTSPGSTGYSVQEGTVSALFTILHETECYESDTTFSTDDCESIYSQITTACPGGSGKGVGGGTAYAATCYGFGVQLLTSSS